MIRIADINDLEKYSGLARSFYESTGRTGFSEEAFLRTWTHILSFNSGFIMGRFGEDGPPKEAIGVITYPDMFEDKHCAACAFWYVNGNPGSLSDGILFNALMGALESRQINSFFFEALHNDRMHKVTHFLHKSGFKVTGTNYRKDF